MTEREPSYHLPLTREAITAASVFAFSIMAHLFCWTNVVFSHDSTLVNQIDAGWQISIGRYLNPVYVQIRGTVVSPLFVGILATVYIAIAAILIIRLLDLKSIPALAFTGMALSTYATVTLFNATFQFVLDVYFLSTLLAVIAVYLPTRLRGFSGYALGSIFVFISLALYQSNVQLTVVLALISLTKETLEAKPCKSVLRRGFSLAAMVIAGGILYAIGIVAALLITDHSIAHTYHGIDSVGDFTDVALAPLFLHTYLLPFKRLFIAPLTLHPHCIALFNAALAMTGLYALVRLALEAGLSKKQLCLLAFLTLMLPLGMNFVYFVSKGLFKALTIYSYSLFYVWAMMLFDMLARLRSNDSRNKRSAMPHMGHLAEGKNHLRSFVVCAGTVILLCNVGFSNELYLVKALEEQATLSYLTRVEDRMEQVEGYVPGETPVVFAGSFYAVTAVSKHEGLKPEEDGITGFYGDLAITYYETYESYFQYILGCPINIADRQTMIERIQTEQVREMPVFPASDSCAMVDGVMVVRISEDLQQELNYYDSLRS